jgi:hypothetical protein
MHTMAITAAFTGSYGVRVLDGVRKAHCTEDLRDQCERPAKQGMDTANTAAGESSPQKP